MSALPMTKRTCPGCGTKFYGKGRAKWCNDRCRKDTCYVRNCVDCGARLGSSDGNGPNAPLRCPPCAAVRNGAERKIWTRDACVEAIHTWTAEHGEPPAICDWSPTHARNLHADARAQQAEAGIRDGRWPHSHTVIREFGSWRAGIQAAGFEPRAPHGGDGNQKRNRHYGKGLAKTAEIVRLYREGLTYRQIAAAVPCTAQDVCWVVWNARKAGVDLPYRRAVAA